MNVKQFKRRWLNSKIEPELFYMPVGKNQKDEFIFEVEDVTEVKWSSYCNYLIYGQSTKPTINKIYENNPSYQYIPKDNNVLYHFSFDKIDTESEQNPIYYYQTRLFEQPKDDNDEDITKDTHPELFTDWSIHNLRENLLSENMIISPNEKVTVNWGDGSSDTFDYTDERFLWDETEINGKIYRVFRGYNNKLMCHTYKEKGTYIIKITGFLPCLSLPAGTTRIINWGNIGLRYFPNFSLCQNTFKDLGIIKNLDNVVFIDGSSLGACIHASYNSENFKFVKDLKSLVFVQSLIYLERLTSPLNDLLSNCPYLVSAKNIFCSNSNWHQQLDLSGVLNRDLGDNLLMNCPELRIIKPLFYFNVSYNANYQIKIQIGDNFLRKCPNIWSTEELFYIGNYTSQYEQISSYAYTTRLTYKHGTDIQKIGNYCLAECDGLTYVSKTFSYINIENIGEGLFYNNQNIRQASNLFFNCNNLRKVPDKLFYYLKSNQDYVGDYFVFTPLVSRSDINSTSININSIMDFENIPKTEIGENMFSDSFLSLGKIIISGSFVSPINTTIRLVGDNGAGIYDDCDSLLPEISSSLYCGEVPDLWNYVDNVGKVLSCSTKVGNTYNYDYLFVSYNQLFSFNFPEKYLSAKPTNTLRFSESLFGRERGMFGVFDSYNSFVNWSNYDLIPKKTKYQYYGQDLTNIDDIKQISNISERLCCSCWLTPLMFDDINLSSYVYLYDYYFMLEGNSINLQSVIDYAVVKGVNIEDFVLNCELDRKYAVVTPKKDTVWGRCLINGKPPVFTTRESQYPLVSDISTMEFISSSNLTINDDGSWRWWVDTETLNFKLNSCMEYYTIPVDIYNMGRMRCGNSPIIGGKTFGFATDPYHVNYYEFGSCRDIKLKATIDYSPILTDMEEQLIDKGYFVNIYEIGYYAGYPNTIQTINALIGGNTTQNKNGTFGYGVGSYEVANPGDSILSLSVTPVSGFYGDYKLEESLGESTGDICNWCYNYYSYPGVVTSRHMSEFYTSKRPMDDTWFSTNHSIDTTYLYKTVAEKMSEYYGKPVDIKGFPHFKKFDFNTESSFNGKLDEYNDVSGAYMYTIDAKSSVSGSFSTVVSVEPQANYAKTDYGVYYIAK